MDDWKKTCQTIANYMIIVSTVALATATTIGALISTLENDKGKDKNEGDKEDN